MSSGIKKQNIFQIISLTGLILYIIAVFFGPTGPQWPQKLEDAGEISMSNPVNQVVYTIIFLLSLVSVLPKYKVLLKWLDAEKYIIFFFAWCAITIVWAIDSTVSFKRLFQYLTTSLVFISVLINYGSERQILNTIKYLLSSYVLISLIVVLIIPQATDPTFDTWRGLHPTKNNLGQTASLCIIFFTYYFYTSKKLIEKSIVLFLLFISVLLLVGAFSMTNIILMFIFTSVFIFIRITKIFSKLGIGSKFSLLTLFFSLMIISSVFIIAPDLYLAIFDIVGKDPTLTGRTEIWALVLSASIDDLIIGVGFQSFWIPQHLVTIELFKYWIPTQSHNGYVDLVLETGIVGLSLFIFSVIFVLKQVSFKEDILWVLFILFAILLNFSESTFIRPHHPTNVMFYASFWVISYKTKFIFSKNEII